MLPSVDDYKQLYAIETLENILAFCQPLDITELVLKNGPESVYCQLDGQLTHVAITPVTHVVEPTSAGDSFNGVYLGARLTGLDISSSKNLTSATAGIVIQHPGAIAPADAFDSMHTFLLKSSVVCLDGATLLLRHQGGFFAYLYTFHAISYST